MKKEEAQQVKRFFDAYLEVTQRYDVDAIIQQTYPDEEDYQVRITPQNHFYESEMHILCNLIYDKTACCRYYNYVDNDYLETILV